MLHFLTLLAIFLEFWCFFRHLIREGFHILGDSFSNVGRFFENLTGKKRPYHKIVRSSYRKYVMLLIVSTIPTGLIGVIFKDYVEQANQIALIPACCLMVTAVFLVIADMVEPGSKRPKNISYGEAAMIGISQGVATLPGVSRSGTTITACLLCGFDKKFAVKYSFIMSIPAVLGAVVLEVKDLATLTLTQTDIIYCIIAMVVAAVSGYLAIRFMMGLIRGRRFKYFAIYCAVVSVASVIALLRG